MMAERRCDPNWVEEQISDAINRLAYPSATIHRIVKDAIKTARQEALREAAKVADQCALERKRQLFSAFDQQCRDFISCKQSEAERIAEKLDRLASEGG